MTSGRVELALSWLSGLLEAEGTFLKPPPAQPGCPAIACGMTDRDVVERVAVMLGSTVHGYDKGPHLVEFRTTVKGARAAALMLDLVELMGARRSRAILEALRLYKPAARKLSYDIAQHIRAEFARGEVTKSQLARRYRVSHPTIRRILAGRMYRTSPTPWRSAQSWFPGCLPGGPPGVDLCWLAGWLEGEGSFCHPPPSDPRRPRILGISRDQDVIERVAAILGVGVTRVRDKRRASRTWSPCWRVLKRGPGAVAVMTAVRPLMGQRRRDRIDEILNGDWRTAPDRRRG
jgi:hypothetical protein